MRARDFLNILEAVDALLDLPQEDDIGIFRYITNVQNKHRYAKAGTDNLSVYSMEIRQ
jgi:hypothetical protein